MDYHFAIAKIELSFLLSRYSELLKDDFPRIPFFNDYELFLKACQLGKDMIDLHLLKNKLTSKMRFVVSGDNVVSKIKHDTNRVLINETQYFEGISEEVWDFRIGSYKVLEKYLASRKGRKLEIDELEHFIQSIEVIGRTIQIRKQIDNEFGPYL